MKIVLNKSYSLPSNKDCTRMEIARQEKTNK